MLWPTGSGIAWRAFNYARPDSSRLLTLSQTLVLAWWNVVNGIAYQALVHAVPKGAIQDKLMLYAKTTDSRSQAWNALTGLYFRKGPHFALALKDAIRDLKPQAE